MARGQLAPTEPLIECTKIVATHVNQICYAFDQHHAKLTVEQQPCVQTMQEPAMPDPGFVWPQAGCSGPRLREETEDSKKCVCLLIACQHSLAVNTICMQIPDELEHALQRSGKQNS